MAIGLISLLDLGSTMRQKYDNKGTIEGSQPPAIN